ncbi:regulator of MON1-CCZ1 complex [Eurosta solidaginis]|uniref:regulator of MON1-CCZ1 complex n=1 Tax=Eurosta solidaginis TaxID=178769 RepID=UPI003531667B
MDEHYIELSKSPIRFDAGSQLTNVFFDDSNKQIFAVRSGGATGVIVKGPTEDAVISFCMNDRGTIRSIKFSPDNKVLAVQRRENAVEFICFQGDQPQLQEIIVHQIKALVYGFVWVHAREVAIISNSSIEIFTVSPEKRQVRTVKSLNIGIKWFAWCADSNIALICSTDNNTLVPILIKQKSITKLPKLEMNECNSDVQESKVTLGQVYGTMSIFLLQVSADGMMEVDVYLLNGPGLAPRKCHVLRLGHVGRFAINTVDNLIVVHHQASASSLLFDIALPGEESSNGVIYHTPITPGRSIRPFALKLPSLSPDGQSMQCELYSIPWVLFQPNIVIDARLGCMWYLNLNLEPLCTLITDRMRLTEFLLQRSSGKQVLLKMLRQMVDENYNGTSLPVLETIFNKINKIYASWVQLELHTQTAQPSNVKTIPKLPPSPKVLIEQHDMLAYVFQPIAEREYTETILIHYLHSLNKHNIAAQEDLSKLIISELIRNRNFDTLRRLVSYSLLLESKPIACFLLSHSNVDAAISQIALDMLSKIGAHDIIIEVLLGQGKIIDALRLAGNSKNNETISARKFLEAAQKTNDDLIFHSVFKFFQMRNLRQRGTMDFLKTEQCGEFVQYYSNLYPNELSA